MNTLQKRKILQSHRAKKGGRARPILIALFGLLALGSLAAAGGVGALFIVYNGYAKDYVPIEEKLAQTNVGLTEIYDRGGPCTDEFAGCVLLGQLTNKDSQLLRPVPLSEISPWMVEATVSTEDNSFWDNPGVNVKGLARAAYENYVLDEFGSGTGGSSITQQLIKNVYICPNLGDEATRCETAERTLDRKLREITYAIELDQDYTKEEILTWYLNQISYADRYVGVESAAQGYFGKPAKDLTLAESALLAGVPQFPTKYHPRQNCIRDEGGLCVLDALSRTTLAEDAKVRQEAVLDLMVRHNRATQAEVDAAKAEPVLVFANANPLKSQAFIDNQVEPRLVRMCEAGLLAKLPAAADCVASVHSAGYKVTTTLDWAATDLASQMMREAIRVGLENNCECNNAAIATIEPATGEIMVYAPNRDTTYTSDPRVAGNIDQLNEINQPGSSFKPAVYLAWFEYQKKHPYSTLWDTSPLTVEGTAITNPRNDGRSSEGMITARSGLGGSQNVAAFRAAQEAGTANVIDIAKKLGINTLQQGFDPTFYSHEDVTYGASIATGGANIRAIDMAYMETVIANMGKMVGVPHLAATIDPKNLKNTIEPAEELEARRQALEFSRGNIRLPGTRELDPIAILQVRDINGVVLYDVDDYRESRQVVDAGSVWLLHSIMSDCNARGIIWGCGGSNNDLALDFYSDGVKIPSGVKTGTQQGPLSAVDTLETWTTGYSRQAGTALWVGNATNELVNDRGFQAANTTVRLYKNWMGEYHAYLKRKGVADIGATFADLQPKNVAQRSLPSTSTSRGDGGGCDQMITTWARTDVTYASECEEKEIDTRNGLLASDATPSQFRATKKFVKLPAFKPELAIQLAKAMNIPIAPTEKSTGNVAVSITNLSNGRTVSANTQVIGTVEQARLKNWALEIGEGAAPATWKTIGTGTANVSGVLGMIDIAALADGVYTVRLSTDDGKGLSTQVTINIRKGASPSPSPGSGPSPGPGQGQGPGQATPTPAANPTRSPFFTPPVDTNSD